MGERAPEVVALPVAETSHTWVTITPAGAQVWEGPLQQGRWEPNSLALPLL